MPAPNPDEVLTQAEVTRKYKVSESTLKRLRASGDSPPYYRIGNQIFFRRSSLEAWIAAQEQQSVGARPTAGVKAAQ